jgi:hypothetical protein
MTQLALYLMYLMCNKYCSTKACAASAFEKRSYPFNTCLLLLLPHYFRCWGGWDLELAHSCGQLPEDACEMPCQVGDEFCGGDNANAVYVLPPPEAPEDVPEYEYLGEFYTCMR